MAIAILDVETECPDCGYEGAWAQTVAHDPTRELFRCANCEAEWAVTR